MMYLIILLVLLLIAVFVTWVIHLIYKESYDIPMIKNYTTIHYGLVMTVLFVLIIGIPLGGTTNNASPDEPEIEQNEAVSAESEEPVEETSEETTEEDPVEEEQSSYGIGDSVRVGDLEYIIHEVSTSQSVGGEYSEESTDEMFVILNASITNHNNEAMYVEHAYFKLYQGDTQYSSSGDATISANSGGDDYFVLDEINPGSTATGNIVFEVLPEVAESDDLEIRVENGGFASETKMISID